MNLPTLENMYVSKHTENVYARIIAEEDIRRDYGTEIILSERLSVSRQHIF